LNCIYVKKIVSIISKQRYVLGKIFDFKIKLIAEFAKYFNKSIASKDKKLYTILLEILFVVLKVKL